MRLTILCLCLVIVGCSTTSPPPVIPKPVAVKPSPPALPPLPTKTGASASRPKVVQSAFIVPRPLNNQCTVLVCFRYFKHPAYEESGGTLLYDHIGIAQYASDILGPWTTFDTLSLPNYDYCMIQFTNTTKDGQRFYRVSCSQP